MEITPQVNEVSEALSETVESIVTSAQESAVAERKIVESEAIIKVLTNEIDEHDMARSRANRIYRELAKELDFPHKSPFALKWEVNVMVDYDDVFTVIVEADNEDLAIAEVREGIRVQNSQVSGRLVYRDSNYNVAASGDFETSNVGIDEDDLQEVIELSATEIDE